MKRYFKVVVEVWFQTFYVHVTRIALVWSPYNSIQGNRAFFRTWLLPFVESQLPVLYHLKCLFGVLSCSPRLLAWGSDGKTNWGIIITRARKGGQQQWILSPQSCNPFSLWPKHLHLLSSRPWSFMSDARGRHLPFRCLFPISLTPRQMKNKWAQLQLMGWIVSVSSFSLCKTSVCPANTLCLRCIWQGWTILTLL